MTWYEYLPKIELNVHLEGAVPHKALFDLIQKYGSDPSIPNVAALTKRAAYVVEKSINNSGIDAGIAKYQELRSDDQNQLYFSENEFNSLGYDFIAKGMINTANEVFKMNVEMNPQSANAYDSLGEAYMVNKNKVLAMKNYKKSLELNPDNSNAKEMLDKLEKNKN